MKAVSIFTHVAIAVLVAVLVHLILEAIEHRTSENKVVKSDCGCGCNSCGG